MTLTKEQTTTFFFLPGTRFETPVGFFDRNAIEALNRFDSGVRQIEVRGVLPTKNSYALASLAHMAYRITEDAKELNIEIQTILDCSDPQLPAVIISEGRSELLIAIENGYPVAPNFARKIIGEDCDENLSLGACLDLSIIIHQAAVNLAAKAA